MLVPLLSLLPDTQLPLWFMNRTAFQVSRLEWVRKELGVWWALWGQLPCTSLIKLKSSPLVCKEDSGVPGLRGLRPLWPPSSLLPSLLTQTPRVTQQTLASHPTEADRAGGGGEEIEGLL